MTLKAAVTASLTAHNTFTAAIGGIKPMGSISVSGTFVATVVLQRSYDGGSTWFNVGAAIVDVASEQIFDSVEDDVLWRLGIETGGFTSGTAVVRISH